MFVSVRVCRWVYVCVEVAVVVGGGGVSCRLSSLLFISVVSDCCVNSKFHLCVLRCLHTEREINTERFEFIHVA